MSETGQCSCESGVTVEGVARMMRRDIGAALEEAAK